MYWLLVLILLIIFLLLILSFLFSGTEIGLTLISKSNINKLDNNKKAKVINRLLDKKELTIGTMLIGNTIINIICSTLFTVILIIFFSNEGIIFLLTIIMTFCILLFCEVLPKTYAMQNPEKFISFSAYIITFFVKIFFPLALCIQYIVSFILKFCGVHKEKKDVSRTDVICNMIAFHRNKRTILQQDINMLNNILDLFEIEISEIMIHRKNIFSLNIDQNKENLIKEILTSNHSRIPLWKKKPDEIVGVIHVKNLINALCKKNNKVNEVNIYEIMSKPYFLSESIPLSIQLYNFRKNRKNLAFIINKYGSLQGIITLEDILEEIVGEISDKNDLITKNFIKKISDNLYHIEGKSTIKNINRQLYWNLPDKEASTLASMIINEIERVPEEGEGFFIYGFYFKILKKDKNIITIIEVRVKKR